jgi:hypothetical protein
MKLIAGGDSFVWGSELKDHKHGGPGGHSMSTFPALLATEYGLDYECVALPGSGNDSIARRVMEACYDQTDILVLVSWTWTARYEFWVTQQEKWETISSAQYERRNGSVGLSKDFIQTFFNDVGFSDYWETYSSLREITRLQDHLTVRNIPYLFTISDNWFEKVHCLKDPDRVMESMHHHLDWRRWFFFPQGERYPKTETPRGFYQWAVEERYEQGPQLHPLEDAHKSAARLISDRFLTLLRERP